jgi:hypothetical protein
LKGHDHPGNHPHAEGDGEYLDPHPVDFGVHRLARLEPAPFQHGQPAGQTDGKCREKDVKGDGEGELNACQQTGI